MTTICKDCRHMLLSDEAPKGSLLLPSYGLLSITWPRCKAREEWDPEDKEAFETPDLVMGRQKKKPERRHPLCANVNNGNCKLFDRKPPPTFWEDVKRFFSLDWTSP